MIDLVERDSHKVVQEEASYSLHREQVEAVHDGIGPLLESNKDDHDHETYHQGLEANFSRELYR